MAYFTPWPDLISDKFSPLYPQKSSLNIISVTVQREQHCPPAPVDGTIELLHPASLSLLINSQIKAKTITPHTSFQLPPTPGALMDVFACKTTYETLNNIKQQHFTITFITLSHSFLLVSSSEAESKRCKKGFQANKNDENLHSMYIF